MTPQYRRQLIIFACIVLTGAGIVIINGLRGPIQGTDLLTPTAGPRVTNNPTNIVKIVHAQMTKDSLSPVANLSTPDANKIQPVVGTVDLRELGLGIARLYAPYRLNVGELGEIRLEIELYPSQLTPTYKPPRSPVPTIASGETPSPTVTALPEVARTELEVRTLMIARLEGLHLGEFLIIEQRPANDENGRSRRYIEVGSVVWWSWFVRPINAGLNQLEAVVYVENEDEEGFMIEVPRGSPLRFNIEVIDQNGTKGTPLPWIFIIGLISVAVLIQFIILIRRTDKKSKPVLLGTTKESMRESASVDKSPVSIFQTPALDKLQTYSFFISYSRKDEPLAAKLASTLRDAGYHVWRDNDNLKIGTWSKQIDEALKSCSHVLFLASVSSVQSENVNDELEGALGFQKPIIPIVLEECEVPMRIRRFQRIKFSGDLKLLIDDIIKRLH
jgi:hypothetical protein